MRIKAECLYCLFIRAKKQVERLTSDEEIQFKALTGVMRIISDNVNLTAYESPVHPLQLCPAYIGSKRDRFLQSMLQINDTYAEEKRFSKALTIKVLPKVRERLKNLNFEQKLELALALATTANLIEFDLLSQLNESKLTQNLQEFFATAETEWDDSSKDLIPVLISEIDEAKAILYLTDNVGEDTFDAVVIDILLQQGKQVSIAGKSKPILNDATVLDLQELWLELKNMKRPRIVSTGSNSVGLFLEEISNEFREIIEKSDLILAKGMGHFETLPEYEWKQSVWCLFHSKCEPIAKEANTVLGKNCIRKISKG